MKYYLHDTNSFSDEKITELYINFGYEGLGLFYTILEKIAGQEKPIKTSILKSQLNVGKKLSRCWSFMETLGIIQSNNDETFNEQLLTYSKKYQIKKEQNHKRIKRWRENQQDTKIVMHSESDSNAPKVNRSKVNRSKVNIYIPEQSEFLDFCKEVLSDKYAPLEFSLISKYEAWKDNDWINGNGKKIKNWKSAIKNTIPYLKPCSVQGNKITALLTINEQLKNEIKNG